MPKPDILLLLFAYHFPPENAVGGLRPYRYAKYLPRLGVRVRTFTAADVSSRPELDAETVADPFITAARPGFGWQVERGIRKFFLPGASGSQWSLAAYRAACRFLDAQGGNQKAVVFSTYPPLGTTLAGYWLAKKRKLPWILDFRDPMHNPGDLYLGSFPRRIYRFLEAHFVAAADCVIANTDASEEILKRAYPQTTDKITLLWNGFDPEQRLGPLPIPTERGQRIYSHVGELYEARIITPLIYAMDRLVRAGRLSPAKILIQLVGPARSASIPPPEFVRQATNKGWLKIVADHLPQVEAQRIMQESDGLLLVQPQSALQVPAKVFEYAQIGRPILAYILPGSPIERILKQSQVPSCFAYASASNEILDEAIYKFFQLEHQTVKPSQWFEEAFNTQRHAERLLELIHSQLA